jgi:hypothetical protein
MTTTAPPGDATAWTVAQLLKNLRPAQLWGFLTTVAALVTGAFGAGYKVHDLTSSVRATPVAAAAAALPALQTKERFLSLYLRYLVAVTDRLDWAPADTAAAVEEAADSLRSYIQALLRRGPAAEGEVDLKGLILGKPARHDTTAKYEATVKFVYDGSVWPLPARFGFAPAAR